MIPMKNSDCILFLVFLLAYVPDMQAQNTGNVHIIPKPLELTLTNGAFEIAPNTRILVSPDAEQVGMYLQQLLEPPTGYMLRVDVLQDELSLENTIVLELDPTAAQHGEEGYALSASPDAVVISARTAAGLFYGVQTLRQLLPPQVEERSAVAGVTWEVPGVEITDRPRFPWRGMHLDVGRHMFPVEFVKKYIDLLALHKMNTFHWHLTEDQGWRIEIKKYPLLTEIGSRRAATPFPSDRNRLDGQPYGGYYTQLEVREVVAYAQERFITVVPEIEMPGHSVAALASYPELGCTGGPYQVRQYWGIAKDVYCAGNEKVYAFLEDVLGEVMELFPSVFIHIGGDECPKDRWEECEKCQAMIAKEGLADEHELQSYFVTRMEKFLNSHGRRMIGWDEILEGGLAPNAAVMSWRGMEGGIEAATMGHDVVMTPTSHCYLDYYQSQNREEEPPAIGGFLPLEKVYSLEPVPAELPADKTRHILGAQGNLWTEYIPTASQAEYMAFPRASALAEVVWTTPGMREYGDFIERLPSLLKHLDGLGVNYRPLLK
ncbi:MAG TPA: beta-N-acetylglucosaminidase [Bacteroides sp.]|nr:beta-N-acetylglucosaminidase [Bacteroides sp.]